MAYTSAGQSGGWGGNDRTTLLRGSSEVKKRIATAAAVARVFFRPTFESFSDGNYRVEILCSCLLGQCKSSPGFHLASSVVVSLRCANSSTRVLQFSPSHPNNFTKTI